MEEIDSFIAYVNDNSLDLEFSAVYHSKSLNFLDITLEGDHQDGSVHTRTYHKECSGNSLVLATSCHPARMIRSVPMGEFTSTICNCSNIRSFSQECDIVASRLRARCYKSLDIET